jgi:hypothetical protein
MGQEELRAVYGEASDDVSTTIQMPEKFSPERHSVELNRGISIAYGQHGRDLGRHSTLRVQILNRLREKSSHNKLSIGEILCIC